MGFLKRWLITAMHNKKSTFGGLGAALSAIATLLIALSDDKPHTVPDFAKAWEGRTFIIGIIATLFGFGAAKDDSDDKDEPPVIMR